MALPTNSHSGNIIISFEGTVFNQVSTYSYNSLLDDADINSDDTPQAFVDAQSFAAGVIATATSPGPLGFISIQSDNCNRAFFGWSLGGSTSRPISGSVALPLVRPGCRTTPVPWTKGLLCARGIVYHLC